MNSRKRIATRISHSGILIQLSRSRFILPFQISQEDAAMKSAREVMKDMPKEDRDFYLEMVASAVVAAAIVLALG